MSVPPQRVMPDDAWLPQMAAAADALSAVVVAVQRREKSAQCRYRHVGVVRRFVGQHVDHLRHRLTNANLSLTPAGGAPWTVTLWGRNIFNKAYDVTRNFFLPGTEVAQAGEPATFGIRVNYKY